LFRPCEKKNTTKEFIEDEYSEDRDPTCDFNKSFGLLSPQVVSVKIFVYTQRGVWGVRPNDCVA